MKHEVTISEHWREISKQFTYLVIRHCAKAKSNYSWECTINELPWSHASLLEEVWRSRTRLVHGAVTTLLVAGRIERCPTCQPTASLAQAWGSPSWSFVLLSKELRTFAQPREPRSRTVLPNKYLLHMHISSAKLITREITIGGSEQSIYLHFRNSECHLQIQSFCDVVNLLAFSILNETHSGVVKAEFQPNAMQIASCWGISTFLVDSQLLTARSDCRLSE